MRRNFPRVLEKGAKAGEPDLSYNDMEKVEIGVPVHYPSAPPYPYVQPPPNPYIPAPQYAQYQPPAPPSGKWTTRLCGCKKDCGTCCMACLLPCIPFGEIAHILDRGETPCWLAGGILCLMFHVGLPCIYTCGYRKKLRHKYGLAEQPCHDCCVDCCCLSCSLAQQYRELQNRGIQPSLGFENARYIYDQPPPTQHMHH